MVDVFVVGGWLEEGGAACWGSFYETAYSTIASSAFSLFLSAVPLFSSAVSLFPSAVPPIVV